MGDVTAIEVKGTESVSEKHTKSLLPLINTKLSPTQCTAVGNLFGFITIPWNNGLSRQQAKVNGAQNLRCA